MTESTQPETTPDSEAQTVDESDAQTTKLTENGKHVEEDMEVDPTKERKDEKMEVTTEDGAKKRLIRESPCGNDCSNSCNSKFTEELRTKIYDIYWAVPANADEQQKWMEKYCIDKALPKVTSKSMASTRNRTFVYLYFLPSPDDNMQKNRVCKKFLAATLGITERILSGFVYRFVGSGGLDFDEDWSPGAGYENCTKDQIFCLREFIQNLPSQPVHYCRNEQCTRKLYELPSSIPDVSTLFGMYSSAEESYGRDPVEEAVFRNVLHQDYNLAFCTATRSDICSVREFRKGGKK